MTMSTDTGIPLESMTVAELDAATVALKRQVEALRDQRRAIKAVRDRKVVLNSLAKKLGTDVDHLTPEQAATLLEIARGTPPKEGDVVLTPAPGDLGSLLPGQPRTEVQE